MLPHAFLKQVHDHCAGYDALSDDQLRGMALDLGFESQRDEKVAPLLVRGFGLVRTAAKRHLQMEHYDVQLTGGKSLCHGHVIEMGTGEGKTLTATLPLFIHALAGRGALLATANDYLAKRDAEWLQPVFQSLGMTLGVVQSDMSRAARRAAYKCSITYGTMKEFGFDFLRDQLFERKSEQNRLWYGASDKVATPPEHLPVHRAPHFMLVDEADSILIDEARTPMILSGSEDEQSHQRQTNLFRWSAESVNRFEEDVEYWYDKEKRKVDLTPDGTARVRQISKPDSLDGVSLPEMYDFVERAIQVSRDYQLDREYVIRDGEIVIVDEATGRLSEGRRWSRGIHQAIEAKENVDVTMDTQTQAKVTVQSYVSRYPIISGMTGTAATSSKEFKKFYRMPVSVIPPNRPSQRDIRPIVFCKTEQEKWTAVVNDIKDAHSVGRPILVGTRSIAKSELISHLLTKENLVHAVLNARHVEKEADIVAIAGEKGRITVATNMAGRGTDIKIDDEIAGLGGLHVIGTEMHDSARIDRQLLGRCGRQGDPGSFTQYISADDKLIESAFGRATAIRYRKIGKIRSSRWWISLFEKAQRKVENQHYRSRKILMYNEKMQAKSHQEMGLDPILDVYD